MRPSTSGGSSARPRAGGRLRRFPRRVLLQVLFSIHQAKSELTRSELLRLFQDDLVSNRVLAKGAERPALASPCYLATFHPRLRRRRCSNLDLDTDDDVAHSVPTTGARITLPEFQEGHVEEIDYRRLPFG